MFSVMLSIAAETIKLSVSSSVFLLTRYDTSSLAFSMLSFKASSTSLAVDNSILTEKVEDKNIMNITINKITLTLIIKYIIYNTILNTMQHAKYKNKPENLFLMPINILLKKFITDPITTTEY